ncbi:carboxypeptidase-like regulatory domain-containing protein [Pedobacter fastidiosus]|uniref:Carboxypeptidase-like regulatory domain-containing protein n=1 Tax=Pedobacter fastidiosus TaxID=2765361 RepID=A0ABR7KRU6_9SPHI|nr:carboxypeptidase-like regulatory domain-containing protein [Pedobacter fastidiosus]MBC6110728.1 carboxypeptidase-like regulatory domain-containing protein [Pedobacter fastidiosus]
MNKDWLDIDVLEDYLDGKLDAKGMHFVERQALDDPFVAEALEGLRQSPKRKENISILQKQLHQRIASQPIKRKMWGITTQRLSIAATATVAFIAVSILFFMRETNRKNAEIAQRRAKGVIVNLDTNTSIASNKPKQEDTQLNANESIKSALINKAVVDAKTGDFAKNSKSIPPPSNAEFKGSAYAYNRSSEPEIAKNQVAPVVMQKTEASSTLRQEIEVPGAIAALATPTTDNKIISGRVVSEIDGQPLPGASIKVAGLNKGVTSDKDGFFSLAIDSTKAKNLSVNYLGYENTIASIDHQKNLKIALKEDQNSLNEVVVTNYGKAKNAAAASAPTNASNKIVYSGNVVAQNGAPVKGAIVKVAGSKTTTTTDSKGAFSLPVDSSFKNKDILVKADGYNDVALSAASDPNRIRMALTGDKSINEIVAVMGSNGQKKENIPAPKIALRAVENLNGKSAIEATKPIPVSTINYEQYLENNNKLFNPKGPAQYVKISFRVKKNGRPTEFKIVKSQSKQADAEAKRLIETGPDWVLPKKGTDKVEMNVKF